LKAGGDYNQYNADVGRIMIQLILIMLNCSDHDLISQFNTLVDQMNSIALSENKLSSEINSLSATSPATSCRINVMAKKDLKSLSVRLWGSVN